MNIQATRGRNCFHKVGEHMMRVINGIMIIIINNAIHLLSPIYVPGKVLSLTQSSEQTGNTNDVEFRYVK